jgi:hypothetical protein
VERERVYTPVSQALSTPPVQFTTHQAKKKSVRSLCNGHTRLTCINATTFLYDSQHTGRRGIKRSRLTRINAPSPHRAKKEAKKSKAADADGDEAAAMKANNEAKKKKKDLKKMSPTELLQEAKGGSKGSKGSKDKDKGSKDKDKGSKDGEKAKDDDTANDDARRRRGYSR